MDWKKTIYRLFTEGKTAGEQRGRANLGRIPQVRGRQAPPADTSSELEDARDDRTTASEKTTKDVMMGDRILAAMNKPGLPPLLLAKLRALATKRGLTVPKRQTRREDSGTETNMKAYERIYNLLTEQNPHEGEPDHLAAIRQANQTSSDLKSGAKPKEAGLREKPKKKSTGQRILGKLKRFTPGGGKR